MKELNYIQKEWKSMMPKHQVRMVKMFQTMDLYPEYQKILIDSGFTAAPKIGGVYNVIDVTFSDGKSFYVLEEFQFPNFQVSFQSSCFESIPTEDMKVVSYHQISFRLGEDGSCTYLPPEIIPEYKSMDYNKQDKNIL